MIHFSETPSMIMLPLHKKRKLYLLSFLWIQSTSKASEREPAHILCSVNVIVRAILTILLPFQVNQEVLPQYPAS